MASAAEACFRIAGLGLHLKSDDELLIGEVAGILGPPAGSAETSSILACSVRAHDEGAFGRVDFEPRGDDAVRTDDLLLSLTTAEFPFQLLEPAEPGWTTLAFKGQDEPALLLRERTGLFRKAEGWHTVVALLLFHRLIRSRADAIFFHAASVALDGRGALFVGPKGAGKSTVALALAARGHGLLGDETACYEPATGHLLPFRRPVGIKPGPRAAAVERSLRAAGRSPEDEGILRVPVEDLFAAAPPPPAPLDSVVFLEAFAPAPALSRVTAGRPELALMQPIAGSLVNVPPARRVFELVRLLSSVRTWRLAPGDPDETAALVEEVLRSA